MQPSQMVTKNVKTVAEYFRRQQLPFNFENTLKPAKCSVWEAQTKRESNHEK